MKKIVLMALTMTGIAFFSAEAQAQNTEVCKRYNKTTSCYHTKYSENFKVCKNNRGYQICGETPTYNNSTKMTKNAAKDNWNFYQAQNISESVPTPTTDVLIAPQSQSYPVISMNSESTYGGYYPQRHYIRLSYGNSVAEDNRAPYEGLPSPQYDGPEKDNARNINAYNPNANLAPITGRSE